TLRSRVACANASCPNRSSSSVSGRSPTRSRASSPKQPGGSFGIHTEMISDGVMRLHEAGKVTNRKPLYDGFTDATFALGSQRLYRWLDGNPSVRMLPVTDVNGPSVLCRLPRLTS